jgi:hypothetical protein
MAHPDLDRLLNAVLPFAQEMLAKHGEFFPFGASIASDGEIVCHGAYNGEEHPPSQELIDLLTQAFRQQAASGQIRAAALCYDVRTTPPGHVEKMDAICVSAEHENGESADVFLPYKKGWFGKISYGTIFGASRKKDFFV